MSRPQPKISTPKPALNNKAPVRGAAAKKPIPSSAPAKKPMVTAPPAQRTAAPARKPAPPAVSAQKKAPSANARTPVTAKPAPKPQIRPAAPKAAVPNKPPTPAAGAADGGGVTGAMAAGGNFVNRFVQNKVAGVGSYAGGLITSVGDGVNAVGVGIGDSIANTTRYWGQGVAGYGNDIKDSVNASGPRVSTAGNPLGLGGMGQGRGQMTGAKPAAGQRTAGKGGAGNPLGI